MKFTILLLLLCLIFSFSGFAQSPYSVKGSVIDSASNLRLGNTTIMVLNAKDSIMRGFTKTAANGSFTFTKVTQGKFILLITYPGYADYVENFTLDTVKKQLDMGKINLTLRSKILQEVLIKGTAAAIKIKGDTTEFNAKAYTIQPNSKVEDLLKQLPGMQIDKDGKITAQGQTVSKVLVDGEEFFGDDPTLVTKNIRGDMVDKVQLYDKKSDQASFTGIDDGKKTKTINIVLKEDKKNGYFGKLDGAIGTRKYYQEQAMYNEFHGKKKFAVYGIAANTGKVGLGWEDAGKYGSSPDEITDDEGNTYYMGGNDLDTYDGQYNNQGIPVSRAGGVHYDAKWDGDKKSINTNYKIGSLAVTGTKNDQVQNNLPGSFINSNSDQSFNNSVFRQKLDVAYQIKLDTASTIKFSVDGTLKSAKTQDNFLSTSRNATAALLNQNGRTLANNTDGRIFNATVFYTHKFKRTGRTMTATVTQNVTDNDAKGYLNSNINFYNPTTQGIDSTQHTDQYKTNNTISTISAGNISYTEPLSKKLSLIFVYGLIYNTSNADRKSFNPSAPGSGVYNVLDNKFSNDYTFDQLSNKFGANFNYRTQKSTFTIGTRATNVDFKQADEVTGQVYRRSFLNWNPQSSFQYRFSQQSSFRISYNGRTGQPNIDQIQPVRVNTDPLNITLGNPNLKPSYSNSFNINYSNYKVLTDQSLQFYGWYSFTNNEIINNTTTDTTGKNTFQSVNLANHTPVNYYFSAYMGRKIAGINIGVDLNDNGNKSYSYVNNVLNTTTSYNYTARLRLSKNKQKKYDMSISGGPGYIISGSSLQSKVNNNGYTFNGYSYFNVYLPAKIQLSSDANYDYRGKTQTFNESFSKVIWNSSLSKTLLKGDVLKLAITANDILDQNRGFDRSAYNGTISQNTYTTIKRYFLFSVTWDFNKMGGAPKPQED